MKKLIVLSIVGLSLTACATTTPSSHNKAAQDTGQRAGQNYLTGVDINNKGGATAYAEKAAGKHDRAAIIDADRMFMYDSLATLAKMGMNVALQYGARATADAESIAPKPETKTFCSNDGQCVELEAQD